MSIYYYNIIIIFSIIKITNQIDCSTFTSCFSCSINHDCIWENDICSSSNKIIIHWYNNFDNCLNDSILVNNMRNYCINSDYNKKIPIDISSNNYNGNYISESKELFCVYSIDIEEKKKTQIKYSSLNFNELNVYNESINGNIIKYQTLNIYFNGNSNLNIVPLTDNYIYESKSISKIVFVFLYIDISNSITQNFYTKPFFNLTIKYKNKLNFFDRTILITCLIIVLIIIFLNIIFYKYGFYKLEDENRNESNDNTSNYIFDKRLIDNKKLIEMNLELKKYNIKELDKKSDEICTICFDKIKENEFIIILPCNHIFHSDCIRQWLERTLEEPLCPNCKINLLNEFKISSEINNLNIKKNESESDVQEIYITNRNNRNQNNFDSYSSSENSRNENEIRNNSEQENINHNQ